MNENVIFEEDENTPDAPVKIGEGFGSTVRKREPENKEYFGNLIDRENGSKSINEGALN